MMALRSLSSAGFRLPPAWLRIQSPQHTLMLGLDRGETDAISLAVEISASAILIDERKGRTKAHDLGVTTFGTLGLLEVAAKRGKVDLQKSLAKLQETNFRVSADLLQSALKRVSGE